MEVLKVINYFNSNHHFIKTVHLNDLPVYEPFRMIFPLREESAYKKRFLFRLELNTFENSRSLKFSSLKSDIHGIFVAWKIEISENLQLILFVLFNLQLSNLSREAKLIFHKSHVYHKKLGPFINGCLHFSSFPFCKNLFNILLIFIRNLADFYLSFADFYLSFSWFSFNIFQIFI